MAKKDCRNQNDIQTETDFVSNWTFVFFLGCRLDRPSSQSFCVAAVTGNTFLGLLLDFWNDIYCFELLLLIELFRVLFTASFF